MKNCVQFIIFLLFLACQSPQKEPGVSSAMTDEIKEHLDGMLNSWYPTIIDTINGGYLTDLDKGFKPTGTHDKMIVAQARHLWTTSNVVLDFNRLEYLDYAKHGFAFLKDYMWDEKNGGFYQWVDRSGTPLVDDTIKTAYGNAFAIYGLSAYVKVSNDSLALKLLKDAFYWLEDNSHDDEYGGYFQHLNQIGNPIQRDENTPSTSDLGYKDYNSSIHLLEAFSSLYDVWPDPLVRERLQEMFLIVRDTIVNDDYFMNFYFEDDWELLSFKDSSREVIDEHYYLDHVSFTHDIETAFLLMEAAQHLDYEVDKTLVFTNYMMKHALKGWDDTNGGLFDGGYYFKDSKEIRIVRNTKSWWGQAEALHSLALFNQYYPDESYDEFYARQWTYLKKFMIDDQSNGWYTSGLDTSPDSKDLRMAQAWKTTYHNYRALSNIVKMRLH